MDFSTASSHYSGSYGGESICNFTKTCHEEMPQSKYGESTAVALIRMVTSLLSLFGTSSIIFSVLVKRKVKSSKIHPIFVLSIADFLLALLWVIGGGLWLGQVSHNLVWCFTATLMTVILECVAINLTFVYALYTYAHITHMNLSSLITNHFNPAHGWSKLKVGLVYLVAWLLPTVLVMVPFGIVAGLTDVLSNANSCSCGCVPKFANVLPYPDDRKSEHLIYLRDISRVDLCFAIVIALHYIVVFPLLVIYYCRVLRHIKKLRKDHGGNQSSPLYGATEAVIVRGQSQAKHRVFMFLTVFVITGLCNLILACALTVIISVYLNQEDMNTMHEKLPNIQSSILVTTIIQSITVPLQGFLNAIVYGWTREDFLYIMASTRHSNPLKDPGISNVNCKSSEEVPALSDVETSYYDSDDPGHGRYSRQGTPETSLSGKW